MQHLLFSHHPELFYLGKNKTWNNPKYCRTPDVYRFLAPLLWPNAKPLQANAPTLREITSHMSPSQVLLGSWEGLSSTPLDQHDRTIQALAKRFEQFKLMICLRNPLELAPSLYLQSLRGRQSQKNQLLLRKRWYCEIDDWLHRWRSEGGGEAILAYGDRIRNTTNLIGRENVGVFLYEDLCLNSGDFVRSVCRFIGIDENLGVSLAGSGHLHKRLTQGQVNFMKRTDESAWKRWWLGWLPPSSQRNLLEAQDPHGLPAKAQLPAEWKAIISKETREGNRWLVDNLHLPLEEHQYPL